MSLPPPVQPLTTFAAEVEGRPVRCLRQGQGPALVLIHGVFANLEDFVHAPAGQTGLVEALAKRFEVLAYDRPGAGFSPRAGCRGWTPFDYAHHLHRLLAQLGLRNPVVVGHSYGATVALAYALEFPQATAAVAALSPVACDMKSLPKIPLPGVVLPVLGDLMVWTVVPLYVRLWGVQAAGIAFAPEAPPLRHLKRSVRLAGRPSNFHAVQRDLKLLPAALTNMMSRYHELHLPVLVGTGEKDPVCRPDTQARPLQQRLADAKLVIWPGWGHGVPVLHPTETAEALFQFLR